MSYRFTPSPTGKLHMGSARTALVSYVLSKQANKDFIIRIEDTDVARSTTAFETEILDSLKWLGIKHEGNIVRQSQQEAEGVYTQAADILVSMGLAYYCGCSTADLKRMKVMQMRQKKPLGYEGTCRTAGHSKGPLRLNIGAVRMFLEPNEYGGGKDIHFTDGVYGSRHIDIRDLRDVILLRSNGTATYLMANTVDDMLANVDSIVRGADILPQTAIQILLRKVLSKAYSLPQEQPTYTHVPLVLGESGEKLSKRSPTTKSIMDLYEDGIMPEAIVQFILGVGNNSVPRDRALTMDEIVEVYDASQNAKNNVAFSHHQLLHINKLHIRKADNKSLSFVYPEELVELCKNRVSTLNELREDLRKSYKIIQNFDGHLHELHKYDFHSDKCKEFRFTYLEGEPSMCLRTLHGIL